MAFIFMISIGYRCSTQYHTMPIPTPSHRYLEKRGGLDAAISLAPLVMQDVHLRQELTL